MGFAPVKFEQKQRSGQLRKRAVGTRDTAASGLLRKGDDAVRGDWLYLLNKRV